MHRTTIKIKALGPHGGPPASDLVIEAWHEGLTAKARLAAGGTDREGRCDLILDTVRRVRRSGVFFRVYVGDRLVLDTRGSVVCKLRPGVQKVVIRLPKLDGDVGNGPRVEPRFTIEGRAVLAPGYKRGLLVEAFADADLKEALGSSRIDECGQFEIEPCRPVSEVWFRWSQGKDAGRSPRLQPFSTATPARLHVYRPWSGPAQGRGRFEAFVRSSSGQPAVGVPVALLEVALQRCQVLGEALTDGNGAALVRYDASALFLDRPDLRLVVFDSHDTPLLESRSGSVTLPGTLARTRTSFDRVAEAFAEEGLGDGCAMGAQDLRYLAERTGLPPESVAAYATASALAPKLKVPTEALYALADRDAPDLGAALEQAVATDAASPELLERAAKFLPALATAATRSAAEEDLGRGSLDGFLATQVADPKVRRQLAGIILERGTLSAVRAALDEEGLASPPVRFLLDLQAIAGVDVPLANVLGARAGKEPPVGEDLPLLGTSDWERVLEQAYGDRTEPRSRKARAAALEQRAQRLFPEKVFRAEVTRHAEKPWASRILGYLARHPDHTFKSPLPFPLLGDDGPAEAELAALTAYKRVAGLTRDHRVVGTLLDHGITSAGDLAAIGLDELVVRFSDLFEGDTSRLEETHTRALAITSALNVASSFLPVGPRPSLCDCADCKSLFGPAAYLFELLALFRRYTTGADHGHRSLLSHLEERRPDVTHTHLSCPNTTIEVPWIDLVNEILEDRILAPRGTSIAHTLGDGECLPANRQTEGTAEERRAAPQNPPSDEVVGLLATATLPWTLPYDYSQDRARSARDRLIGAPEDVALLVWRSQIAVGGAPESATRALAASTLDLGELQARLVTDGAALEDAWGAGIAAQVAGGSVELGRLREVAGTDDDALEAALDTAFVRAGAALALTPDDLCASGEPPRLTGPVAALTAALDRLHRFERLRRHLGWTVRDLDDALTWLGGALDATALAHVGLLRFLERRLRLAPTELLSLFRDPDVATPATMRPRRVTSAFEERFGVGASTLQVPEATLDARQRAQSVTAQIAGAAGEPLATVDRAFAAGLVASVATASEILALPPADAQAAYRRAVAATARLASWTRRLRLEVPELLDLVALGGSRVMSTSLSAAEALGDALRLVDLADRRDRWPVQLAELRYLVGADPAAERQQGLSASVAGAWLHELRADIDRAHAAAKPLPEEPRPALRAALSRALRAALPPDAADADALADGVAGALEWSAFFPARGEQADAFLSHALREWPGLASVAPPDPAARALELDAAVRSLEPRLPGWLAQAPGAPATWPATELGAVSARLALAVRAVLADPRTDGASLLGPDLDALFLAAGVTPPRGFAVRLLALAIEHLAASLQPALAEQAASVLSVAESASRRMRGAQVLAEWIGRRLGASAATAATLLERMSDPSDPGRPVARAFTDEAGSVSARLAGSQVAARYFAVAGGAPTGDPVVERAESALVFDWSAHPPVDALVDRPFAVELEVRVPAAQLVDAAGTPLSWAVEADGEVDLVVEDGAGARTVLHAAPGDRVRRFDVAVGVVASPELTVRVRYATPAAGGARTLKILARAADGGLDELPWPALLPVVRRLHRASLALREVTLPPGLAVDLDRLAAGAPLSEWLAFFALAALVGRVRTPAALPAFAGLLAGAEASRADLVEVWDLEEAELGGALQLLGMPDPAADPVVLPSTIGAERIGAVLALVDEARRYHLPSTALARWTEAGPRERYEWARAALRAGLEPSEWSKLLAEVHDPVREHLRDAQVDFLVGRDGLSSREEVSDHLLTDVQMSACMTTTRIQFAYSAVQRYVAAAQAGRAPWLPPGAQEDRFAREWVSLRQYRLHEAQMRILVHAENWIDPAIRPTKTPAFARLEQTMSSGPLTLQLAERAMKEYAASLAEVARLETVALVTHEEVDAGRPLAFRDAELYGTHVFARTRAHPQRLYYRRRLPQPDGRWTPWERIDADLEGTHCVAVVAFGRLRLICADFSVARDVRPDTCEQGPADPSATPASAAALTRYEVTLSWIDREHGRWSSIRRTARHPFSIAFADPPDGDFVFAAALPSHFGEVEREVARSVSAVTVEVQLVSDGLETRQSTMAVYLRNDDFAARWHVGTFAGPMNPSPARDTWEVARSSEIPATLEDLTRIRLQWHHETALDTDDWNVDRVRVRFSLAGGGSHVAEVPTGRMGYFATYEDWLGGAGETWEHRSLRGRDFIRFQGGHGETSWQVFEGQLDPALRLGAIVPQASYFDIASEVVPQSVDLSRAVSIQVAEVGNDAIDVRLFSVPHTQQGRMRSRFKVTEQALRELPEVERAWGRDWVTGEEFCYPIETDQRALVALRIHADDTIERMEPPSSRMGEHLGTRPEGQALLSATGGDDAAAPVYCGSRAVAASPAPYNLTVERTGGLSAALTPKILDEAHHSRGPARTFFVERQPEWLADDEEDGDAPLVIGVLGGFWSAWPFARGDADPSPVAPASEGTIALYPRGDASGTQMTALFAQRASEDPTDRVSIEGWPEVSRLPTGEHVWRFSTFWHPQAIGFRRVLESRGLPRLVRIENQELSDGTDLPDLADEDRVDHFASYAPTRFVDPRWPRDEVDFTLTGPFSEYNWELFFDALLHIAQRFDEEGQHDDADEIFALLVDRTAVARAGAWDDPSLYQTAPIRAALELERLGPLGLVDGDRLREDIVAQIERIRANPYQPHLIARGWPTVYARALRIRYAEHLILAGEADFRRAYASDDRTWLESASARFDLAARVLGPAEDSLSGASDDEVSCYASLTHGDPGEPTEGIEVLEPYLPADLLAGGTTDEAAGGSARRHFCAPRNEKLDELRALVADRLLKLRSCQDIDGVRRALSLYGRRIDPALLVRATAAGVDLDVVLGRVSSAKPSLWFQALWQRALQACERARSLEDAWLAAQERADAEELALLQNEQEIRALEAQAEVVSQRLDEARKLEEALRRTIESAEIRREFYASRERLNAQEEAEGRSLVEAGKADQRAADDSHAASDWAWIPTVELYGDAGVQISAPYLYAKAGVTLRSRVGGETGVQVYRANAEGHQHEAAAARADAGLMGREGSFQRRADEWKLQESLAAKDLQKGEHDLAGAQIRVRIAELELDLHERRIDDVKSVRAFLRDKLTARELHAWRADRLRQLRYQQHRIAYELVSQAKAALVREHGLEDQGFVVDPWDGARHGVAAAAGLLHELEKQQQLYLETWRREQEKVKAFSLAERDPLAYLELLQTGAAIFAIGEADYDEDGPGDWFRRVRHVSLDIPAVRGPYTNVNARLTQLRGEVRVRPHRPTDGGYPREAPDDSRFRDDLTNGESIVTNTGVQDDGRLDDRQDGENPPPFAMNGAISTFRIELPPEQNHFDRQTVTDVIVRVALTSRPGGEGAARAAAAARRELLADRAQPVMLALHSAFSNAWHRFVDALAHDGTGELALTFDLSHVPLRLQPVGRIVRTDVYLALPEGETLEVDGGDVTGLLSVPPELRPTRSSVPDPHLPPPIHRLQLREPMRLGEERRIRLRRRSPSVTLRRGWLICWLEGARG